MSISNVIPSIKICGLRDAATIQAMNGLAITEVGLVFAPSKRQVSASLGSELVKAIQSIEGRDQKSPKAAGVFVNYPLKDMLKLLERVPLDIVQLHGQEKVDYYAALHKQLDDAVLWKVVSIDASRQLLEVSQIIEELKPFMAYVDRLLIDAPGGGTGKPFNWNAIAAYRAAAQHFEKPLVIAGGLHVGNVTDLLQQHRVDGIDVSSGVETNGIKDIVKIKEFVGKVIEA